MNLSLNFNINVMKLYNGHRSFYINLTVCGHRIWVMRWDVSRTRPPQYHPRFLSADRLMGWTWGRSKP